VRTIGILGGMSWESTQIYYREMNRLVNQHLGGLHSAPMVMFNVDFAPIEHLMVNGGWDEISEILINHCLTIEKAGAEALVIATNTMHKLAEIIEQSIEIPLIHIANSVGHDLTEQGHQKVGLLGTSFTMEENFYKDRLYDYFGIETVVPNTASRQKINEIIFQELCQGQFNKPSKLKYLKIIDELVQQGAEAIILGCTEIGLLIQQSDCETPLFDATDSHIRHAIKFALNQ
jgi:aspartate racemase